MRGVVTIDGAPLPDAFVFFRHENGGRTAEGVTDQDGRFEMEFNSSRAGAIIGLNTVRISTYVEPRFDDSGKMMPGSGKPERVPKRYNKETELNADVKAGTNEFAFELASQKP